jgi:hypothetical protein
MKERVLNKALKQIRLAALSLYLSEAKTAGHKEHNEPRRTQRNDA